MKIAEDYLKKGYRLVCNFRCAWADDLETVHLNKDGHLKAVVILDEGGRYVKTSAFLDAVVSYPGKMDLVLLITSVLPPAPMARRLSIKYAWSMFGFGVPCVVYRWALEGEHEKGHFAWLFPSEIYGVYSRNDPGAGAQEITEYLIQREKDFEKFHGRDTFSQRQSINSISAVDFGGGSSLSGIGDSFSDSVSDLSAVVADMAALSRRKNRR
ncbi:hypothetical protein [Candidatus Magnetobacterium casense]|uniref:Uncharacterized protein n=1 Tax=Candidatus Magnetobacterium casense TaxID=1455061 RepID=A0ABS6S081_9BACT|nr:hypothetical protein [Candidatus Magnetobacterium casensis]MBV6342272.1 hypothetical protein [Candidatus Magnetobacterium casensis]